MAGRQNIWGTSFSGDLDRIVLAFDEASRVHPLPEFTWNTMPGRAV